MLMLMPLPRRHYAPAAFTPRFHYFADAAALSFLHFHFIAISLMPFSLFFHFHFLHFIVAFLR
jgi:hypothetical protein